MRWLHLSDIHYIPEDPAASSGEGRSTKQMRDMLKRYLRDENIKVDHVFVCGDFRSAGHESSVDGSVSERALAQAAVGFIMEIADCVGVSDPDRIHIVPGNHDLTRGKNDLVKIEDIRKLYQPSEGKFVKKDLKFLTERFSYFKEISRALHGEESFWLKEFQPLHNFRPADPSQNLHCHLIYINTAITSNSDKDKEQEKLFIGNRALYDALTQCEEADKHDPYKPITPIFILAHHSLNDLNRIYVFKLEQ